MEGKEYRIIYDDEYLMVVDKPAGMLVIPTPKKEKNTLTDLLNRELDKRGVEANAHPCHRIDRETSGLIIYAKGKKMQALMMDEFKNRAVKKSYIAFVHGTVKEKFGVIDNAIFNPNKGRKESAQTKFTVVGRHKDFTVVEAVPVTGRLNQIRIHMKRLGHPLVGESVFAFRKDFKLKFKRAALHASYLRFKHPATGEAVEFKSPLPEDMQMLLQNQN
jgi:23S rRNA pseudouridine1911/1915/1917 synthase